MKILTGSFKGRAIPFTPADDLRPTTDKVRKAVFDVFQEYVEGKRVLDLYSGTGAMGFEALSRKASFVRFVERDGTRAKTIEKTLQRWHMEDISEVLRLDVIRAITRLGVHEERHDLVFVDPPYNENLGAGTLKALDEAGLVKPGGFVAVECGKREVLPEKTGKLSSVRDKRYGQSRIVIYRSA